MSKQQSKKLYIVSDSTIGNIINPVYVKKFHKLNYDLISMRSKKSTHGCLTVNILGDINNILSHTDAKYHDTIKTMHYKNMFAEFMTNNGFSNYVPKTYSCNDSLQFPCVIKSVNNCGGKGIVLCESREMYDQAVIKYKDKYIVQDFVITKIMASGHLLCKNGKILLHVIYFANTPSTYHIQKGRITGYTKRQLFDGETEIFSSIIGKLNYTGVCCVDYGYNDNISELKIFEINPRFGGSLVNDTEDFFKFTEFIRDNDINIRT